MTVNYPISVGYQSQNVRPGNESYLGTIEHGGASGLARTTGNRSSAYRNIVRRGHKTFRARDQLGRQKRSRGSRMRETRNRLHCCNGGQTL